MTRADSPVSVRNRLRARSERLPDATDVLDHLGEGGAVWLDGATGFVTAGVAASVAPAHAVEVLRTIEPDPDAPAGIGVRAVGALPFAGGGRLIVPARIVQRDESGGVWRTVVEPAAVPAGARPESARRAPTSFRISQVTGSDAWEANVAAVLGLVGGDGDAHPLIASARAITVPVELAVEKELGFSGKADIEAFGVAEFNARCRESVLRHVDAFEQMTERMGYWVDTENPYRTMDTPYVESVWWALQQIHAKGLLVEDYRVAPYCPRCGTGLSDHELAQGYETVTDPSVYVRFPLTSGPYAGQAAQIGRAHV